MQSFLADIQYFTIEEAAALIANKYGWHEDAQKAFVKQLLGAAKDATLIVRRPHRDFPHRPKEYHESCWVRVFDLNRYLEAARAPWRLDNSDEKTEWWNLHQVLRVAQVFPHQRAIAEVATRQIESASGCQVSFDVAQQALIEALQTCKLTAYGLKNGEAVLTEIPPLQWAGRTFLWHPDYAGLGASRWIALRFRRKDILALWPVPLDQPDKAPAEEEAAAATTSCDTAARAATSKHTANVGEEPWVPSVHVGDNAFRSNAFTSMGGLTWSEITITFIGTESIRIRARGRNETCTFDAMGFRHRRSHIAKPNESWKTFLHLAIVSTFDKNWNDVSHTHDLKKRISRLRRQLQRFFGIAEDPIVFSKRAGYKPAFSLMAEEHAIQNMRERYTDHADEDEGDDIQQVMSEVPGKWSR